MQVTENDAQEKSPEEQNDVVINIIPTSKPIKQKNDYDYDENQTYSTEETEYSSASLSSSEDESSTINENKNQTKKVLNLEKINNLSDLGYDSGVNTHDDDEDDEYESGKTVKSNCKFNHDHLPEDLKIIFEGITKNVSIVSRDQKPNWFSIDKYHLGQIFAEKYYFCINYAEMISLFMLFTFDLHALMFTNKSGTPYTSFKRYLSTVLRVKSWFQSDVFDSSSIGYNNIKVVRAMHQSVNKQLTSLSEKEIENTIDRYNNRQKFTCPLQESIRDDFQNTSCPCICYKNPKKSFSQCSMSITQFGFVGLIVTFPEKLGVGTASDEELEGFVHLWKTVGYLLGIDDKYNFCNGSLAEVRERSRNLINYLIVPNFGSINDDWEHYSRCVVEGLSFYIPDVTFESSMLYLCYTLNIDAKKIKSKVTWKTYFYVNLYKFMCHYLFKYQCILNFFNKLLNKTLTRAKNFSNEELQKFESVSNEYMRL